MPKEDLIELVDDAVSWMVAAKKSHPSLLLPAWVDLWRVNRPTPRALDVCPRCEGVGRYSDIIGMRFCLLCDGTGKRK